MKKILALISLVFMFSLTACTQNGTKSDLKNSSMSQTESSSESHSNITLDQNDYLKSYSESFAAYEYTGELEATFDDRYFELQKIPENIVEELVVNDYYYDISCEFDKLSDIYGENEALKISANNTKKNFGKGIYIKEFVIHNISTLTKEDLLDSTFAFTNSLQDDVLKFKLTDFTIIKADITMTWSEEALNQSPQLGDGRYERFFLCGKNYNSDYWKIYEVYWY